MCVACNASWFTDSIGSTVCSPCDSCSGQNFTFLCTRTNDSVCIETCPVSWSLDDDTGLCEKCNRGYYVEEGLDDCVQCPANHYCLSMHQEHMRMCPGNQWLNSTSLPGSDMATDCICTRSGGYEGNALGLVGCRACKAGFYLGPSTTQSACEPCPSGNYSEPAALICQSCPDDAPYTYAVPSTTKDDCHECPTNHYKPLLTSTGCQVNP
jgi:hypothetical protein